MTTSGPRGRIHNCGQLRISCEKPVKLVSGRSLTANWFGAPEISMLSESPWLIVFLVDKERERIFASESLYIDVPYFIKQS